MLTLLLLLFSSTPTFASSPCEFIDLRAKGGAMETVAPQQQGSYGICYATGADEVYDALRAHFATRDELNAVHNEPTSSAFTALAFEAKHSESNPHFVADKTDALEIPVAAGNWRPWLQTMLNVAKHVNVTSDEAAVMSLYGAKLRTLDLFPVAQTSTKKSSRFYFEGGDECRTIARLIASGSCSERELDQTIDRTELNQLLKHDQKAFMYEALADEDTEFGKNCQSTWSRVKDLGVISEQGESNSRSSIVDQCHKQALPVKMQERLSALHCRSLTIEPLLRQAYRQNASIAELKTSVDKFKSKAALTFNHDLHVGAPIGTSICAAPLMKPAYTKKIEGTCGPHAVVTIGQRPRGNTCQYLVRNSWGPKTCDVYASSLRSTCEPNGDLWIDADKYLGLIHGVASVADGF